MVHTVCTFAQAFQDAPDVCVSRGPFLMLQAAKKLPANVTAVWEVEGVNTQHEAMAAVMQASVGLNPHSHIKVNRLS